MLRKLLIYLFLIGVISTPAFGFQGYEILWDSVLKQHVYPSSKRNIKTHVVDYETLQDSQNFKAVLRILENFDLTQLKTKEDQLAFWANVYNIGVFELVSTYYPVSSIKKLKHEQKPAILAPLITVDHQVFSLSEIVNKKLRPLNEPLFHFALCSGGLSAPDIRTEAYTASKILAQLEDQAQKFLTNPEKGLQVHSKLKTYYVSDMFKKYGDDFTGPTQNLTQFLSPFTLHDLESYKMKYLYFFWTINEK